MGCFFLTVILMYAEHGHRSCSRGLETDNDSRGRLRGTPDILLSPSSVSCVKNLTSNDQLTLLFIYIIKMLVRKIIYCVTLFENMMKGCFFQDWNILIITLLLYNISRRYCNLTATDHNGLNMLSGYSVVLKFFLYYNFFKTWNYIFYDPMILTIK